MAFDNSKKIKDLFKVSNNLVSIGYNCFFKKFLKTKIMFKKETHFFDNIGISMWAINELLSNDFEDFFNHEYYKKIQIKNNEDNNFLSNTKYYVRFPHDLEVSKFNNNYNNRYFVNFVNTYQRRKIRLYNFLTNCKKIIFLRLEEDNDKRIFYPEYEEKFINTEFENLISFSEIIKKKFNNQNFVIIFISRTLETNIDDANNIIILNSGEYKVNDWKKSQNELESIFLSNYDYLKNFIEKKLSN